MQQLQASLLGTSTETKTGLIPGRETDTQPVNIAVYGQTIVLDLGQATKSTDNLGEPGKPRVWIEWQDHGWVIILHKDGNHDPDARITLGETVTIETEDL
ncbi:hypothetical protein [Microvirga tunisiensis]|uniref:Uncharacterized protein n=1 Tax=Microvirga tunisiensis TaxID=2108360 RepID=A0A5N7MND4_9HYPH|nr:hypothetical protein [Microvirga tunisiensis]MPR10152.1 hypothetical protein [Microvirga tunisiensis]MPR28358.1 hypothetical protein [Microvirga tunisiensis]